VAKISALSAVSVSVSCLSICPSSPEFPMHVLFEFFLRCYDAAGTCSRERSSSRLTGMHGQAENLPHELQSSPHLGDLSAALHWMDNLAVLVMVLTMLR
jgi:hypothetical protein